MSLFTLGWSGMRGFVPWYRECEYQDASQDQPEKTQKNFGSPVHHCSARALQALKTALVLELTIRRRCSRAKGPGMKAREFTIPNATVFRAAGALECGGMTCSLYEL
jgi:hypothetical protein